MSEGTVQLSPRIVLQGYRMGMFPMADSRHQDAIGWYAPDPRAILPLHAFHASSNLEKLVDRGIFEVDFDVAFESVMRACSDRATTWISEEIIRVYTALHQMGYAHSVECRQGGELVGGLYGVAIGGAFFGESMFFRVSNASKVALVHLVRKLRKGGFTLLDTQYSTPHLEQFGVIEIPRSRYDQMLGTALEAQDAMWLNDSDER